MSRKNRRFKTILMCLAATASIFMITACAGFYSTNLNSDSRAVADDKIRMFSASIRKDRLDPKLMYQQAYYFLENRKFKVAAALLQDLIKLEPENAHAHNALGVAYDYLGDHNRAIRSYQAALMINPELDYVWNNIGYSHMMQNDYDAALKAFERAIQLDSHNPKYHNNIALSHAKLGNYPLAFSEFCAGGGVLRAHYNLAKIYYSKGEFKKAQEHFARVLKIDSMDKKSQKGSMASAALADILKSYNSGLNSYQTETTEHSGNPAHSGIILPADEHSNSEMLYAVRSDPKIRPRFAKRALIQISNGNGIQGMAGRVKDYLTSRGYQNVCVSNANHYNHRETVIFYAKDYLQTAYQIARQIPGLQNMKKIEATKRNGIKIKILLGMDMVAYDNYFLPNFNVAKL